MEIKTKFSVDQKVWFMLHDTPNHSIVQRIMISVQYSGTYIQYECLNKFRSESEVFGSKEDLITALMRIAKHNG